MKKNYGCIIGRFQSPYLHTGHTSTIDKVLEKHENLIICVGQHAGQNSSKNPLDFRTRQLMLQSAYPNAIILAIPDKKSNEVWSRILDERIKEVLPPMTTCTLYGSRDSFIPYYTGTLETVELESPDVFISATQIRDEVIEKAIDSEEFRAGCMYAISRRFPSPYATVDFAIIRDDKILLVQKVDETGWRFGGGFGDNVGDGWEADALREAREELGDSIVFEETSITYIMSAKIDDWRYRGSKEKIKTILYAIYSPSGEVEPRDDIKYAKWVAFEDLDKEDMEPEHLPLLNGLIERLVTLDF